MRALGRQKMGIYLKLERNTSISRPGGKEAQIDTGTAKILSAVRRKEGTGI